MTKKIALKEELVFLKHCGSDNLLLPSKKQKNVDLDLLLIQKLRKILKDLRGIKEQIKNLHSNRVTRSVFLLLKKKQS